MKVGQTVDAGMVELLHATSAEMRRVMRDYQWPAHVLELREEGEESRRLTDFIRRAATANCEEGLQIADGLALAGRFEEASRVIDAVERRWSRFERQARQLEGGYDYSETVRRAEELDEGVNEVLDGVAETFRKIANVGTGIGKGVLVALFLGTLVFMQGRR